MAARGIDVSAIEQRFGMKLGPVMRELLSVAARVRPDEPASAFPHVAGRNSFTLAIFDHAPDDIADEGVTPPNVRPFAMDDKSHYGLLVGSKRPASTDVCPVVLVDWGEDEIRIVARDLQTFLSQLAFVKHGSARRRAQIEGEQKELRAVNGLNAALATAKLPKQLAKTKLESSLGGGEESDDDDDGEDDASFKESLRAYAAEREAAEAAPADIPTLKSQLVKQAAELRESISTLAELDPELTGTLRETLAEIGGALARIAAGTYGRCVSCRKPIDDARLKKMPAAPYCGGCDA